MNCNFLRQSHDCKIQTTKNNQIIQTNCGRGRLTAVAEKDNSGD